VNQQLHCLALELLVVSFLNLLFLHGFSLFTLSFRVRKIRGGSKIAITFPIAKNSLLDTKVLRIGVEDSFERVYWAPRKDLVKAKREYAARQHH